MHRRGMVHVKQLKIHLPWVANKPLIAILRMSAKLLAAAKGVDLHTSTLLFCKKKKKAHKNLHVFENNHCCFFLFFFC